MPELVTKTTKNGVHFSVRKSYKCSKCNRKIENEALQFGSDKCLKCDPYPVYG